MTEADSTGPRRERVIGVLGVFLGIVLILFILQSLSQVRGGTLDAAGRAEELFLDGAPFGLEAVEAARLPSGEVLLRLEAPGADDEPGETFTPKEVLLVEYTSIEPARAHFTVDGGDSPFSRRRNERTADRDVGRKMLEWEEDPDFAWHTAIERDEIAWSTWRANYVIERSFREGGGWGDSARVDLTQPGRPLVLFAQWPDETFVEKGALRSLLRSIRMLAPEE